MQGTGILHAPSSLVPSAHIGVTDMPPPIDPGLSTEEECRRFLSKVRWGAGFRCRNCRGTEFWEAAEEVRVCTHCQKQHSLTSGTAMHRRRLDYQTWVRAATLMVSRAPTGATPWFQAKCGLGNKNTASSLAESLLSWMAPSCPRDDFHYWIAPAGAAEDPLSGAVEVESLRVSGTDRGCKSPSASNQQDEFLAAVEVDATGRVERAKVTRIAPPLDDLDAQIARWRFLRCEIENQPVVRLGACFSEIQRRAPITDPGCAESDIIQRYVRWKEHVGSGRLDWGERLRDLVLRELPAGAVSVRRDHLGHYVRKATFRSLHPGRTQTELLEAIFARALKTGQPAHPPRPT